MAWEDRIKNIGREAAESLASDQYRFVVIASGKARRPDSASEVADGVLQNSPASGGDASIMTHGFTKVVAGEALAVGEFVRPEYVSAADAGKAVKSGAYWQFTRGIVVEAAVAEDDLATILLIGPFPPSLGVLTGQTTVTTDATADARTYTAAELLGGLILRDCAGGARSDVTPTAALIIAAMRQAGVGNSFEFTIRNTSDAAETITVTAGTGVTLSGTMTIAQNNSKRFICIVTASTTVTIYSLGTVVH